MSEKTLVFAAPADIRKLCVRSMPCLGDGVGCWKTDIENRGERAYDPFQLVADAMMVKFGISTDLDGLCEAKNGAVAAGLRDSFQWNSGISRLRADEIIKALGMTLEKKF